MPEEEMRSSAPGEKDGKKRGPHKGGKNYFEERRGFAQQESLFLPALRSYG